MQDKSDPIQPDMPKFKNLWEVFSHLKQAGYRISKSKVYYDADKGNLKILPDKSVLESEVRAYAGGLDRVSGNIDDLNNSPDEKRKKEIEKLDEQVKKFRFERRKEEGKYILKSEVDKKIVSTIVVLDTSFRQLIDMRLSDICHTLSGDIKRLNDAKDQMDLFIDEMMNKLSRTDSFQIGKGAS